MANPAKSVRTIALCTIAFGLAAIAHVVTHPAAMAGESTPHEQRAWQPSGGRLQLPLWPARLPIAKPELTGPETTTAVPAENAGHGFTAIHNVARPTLTIYRPTAHKSTGTAILVFPGGG